MGVIMTIFAIVLVILYTLLNMVIMFVAGVTTLRDGLMNNKRRLKSIRDYVRVTMKNYSEIWRHTLH